MKQNIKSKVSILKREGSEKRRKKKTKTGRFAKKEEINNDKCINLAAQNQHLVNEINLTHAKVDESLAGYYIKLDYVKWCYIFKRISFIDYLDEIKKDLANMINNLTESRLSWKFSFIVGLYYYYQKDDKVFEKKRIIPVVYGISTVESDAKSFTEETILKMVKSRFTDLMKRWKVMCLVLIKWVKSPDSLKYKNRTKYERYSSRFRW